MASYRSTFENFYSDKTGFYSTIGAIVPVLVNNYTDSSNSETTESAEYAHNGFLYCDGDQYEIREYPLLYQLIKNDYNKSTETFSNNSIVFDSAGSPGTIYRTFVDSGNLYAEIYDNENIGTDGGVTKVRSVPNKANLRFVDSLGSFPDGGIFEADEDYQLEYSEGFQDLATLSGTHVFRFLVDGAGASYDVVWSVSIPALVVNFDGQYVLPVQYYGTVPFYEPPENNSETGYDEYDDALNDSPQISWGIPSGLPTDVTVDSYEIYLENRSVVEDLVHWHLKDIPSSITFLSANAEPPTGSSFENPTVYDDVNAESDGTRPWIRSNGYAGPQPEDGTTNIYVLNVIANLSNGQTLIISKEFIAGNNPLATPVFGDSTYENNLTVQGASSSITNTAFNVTFSSLTTHPEIRIKKNFTFSDYPYFLGKFRVPDYRDKKLIGYGEGVNGAGTALVGNAATIQVGDVGGQWFISTDVIEDPDEFFAISDVLTTGYSDVQTQIQPYLTGSKKYVVGPVGDYAFPKPAEHQHQLLNSIVYEGSETSVGGVDTFAVKYQNTKGSVIDFTPGGENSDGFVLGHAHGLLGEKPINNSMATYGNVEGIGEKSEDTSNPGCYLYGITESPPLDTTGVSFDGTYITVVVNGDHDLDVGDWVTITNGSILNGSYQIISTGFTATTFKLQPDPAIAATPQDQDGAVVKQASGVFDTVTEIPNPDVWAVNSNTVIGGKETIAFEADQYVLEVDEELESSGSISIGADDAGANAMKYEIKLYAPGGGGGGTTGNGGNAGNASVTFSIDGVSYTVSATGGRGGTSGNSGGAGGNGGTYTIPAALLTNDRVDISYDENGPDGNSGGSADKSTPPGGTQNGGPNATSGNGGKGGYSTTAVSGSFNRTFTSSGSYNATTDTQLPTISGTKASITSVKLDISGGGGGNGNSTSNNNCSTVGGTGAPGRRVVGTSNGTSFSFEIGTKGGNGFNNGSTNGVEATNTAVGTGPANGGNGGRGAWYNAGTGGAGGGATGVKNSAGWILGAGGGGGAGGSGGNGNNNDGCSSGVNGKGPAGNVVSTNNVAPYSGKAGGIGGCTAGGGGGGGGGWNDEAVGGNAGSADGGAAGEPHPTEGTFGGGGGGQTGGSAYNPTYVSAVTESTGSSSGGYVKFTVNYNGTQTNKSGGGGGAGGAVVITLSGTKDDIGSFATSVTASLGNPGNAGSGGGTAGNAGYVQVRVFSIDPGEAEVVGISTPAGRVWETEGFPTNTATGAGSTTGGGIWHSSSDDVNVKQSSTGTFANAATLSPVSDRFIEFAGSGNRFLQLGPLNLSAAEELYFTVIKGNGSNGGDAPEEPLELYYKTSVDSTSENLIQNIAAASVSASGWVNYKIELDEDSPARKNNVYLVIRQTRAAGSNDNDDTNEKNLDKWGLAQFAVVYGEVSKQVFTPSLNASIPGNDDDGDCGPDVGIDYVRRTVTAAKSNITFTDGTFQLSTSTPISVTGTASVVDPIPLITRYHRAKYLIKAF